eukprot:c50279_g1_i1 orf=3-197(-)
MPPPPLSLGPYLSLPLLTLLLPKGPPCPHPFITLLDPTTHPPCKLPRPSLHTQMPKGLPVASSMG